MTRSDTRIEDQTPPLSVAVLVDLERRANAGGHVKCWERLSEAAEGRADLDLTVYFLGDERTEIRISDAVRYRILPPLFSSNRMPGSDDAPDHSDLAPFRPRLYRTLREFDVIHTTDAFFAMAGTARKAAKAFGSALVTSLHTDTPGYTRIYSEKLLRRGLGDGLIGSLIIDRLRVPERLGHMMESKLEAMFAEASFILAPPEGLGDVPIPPGKNRPLRRGIDRSRFHPAKGDRGWLAETHGIDRDRFVLAFAGRLSAGKDVLTLAHAARLLVDQGRNVQALFCGEGADRKVIEDLLGERATLPGVVNQTTLGRMLASSDLFVFPSRIEVAPNVVNEAKACGLPPLVTTDGGGRMITTPGKDGLIIDDPTPEAWATAIAGLMDDNPRRLALAEAALEDSLARRPSWEDVLAEDLMPVWCQAAGREA
ncbi:MAG: glycosyltransferase [Magnetovibrionaceae bacterium]